MPAEQIASRRIADCYYRGMLYLALGGNRVELTTYFIGAADNANSAFALNFVLEDGRHGEDSRSAVAKGAQERVVLEFSYNDRTDLVTLKPEVQITAQGSVVRRKENGDAT